MKISRNLEVLPFQAHNPVITQSMTDDAPKKIQFRVTSCIAGSLGAAFMMWYLFEKHGGSGENYRLDEYVMWVFHVIATGVGTGGRRRLTTAMTREQ